MGIVSSSPATWRWRPVKWAALALGVAFVGLSGPVGSDAQVVPRPESAATADPAAGDPGRRAFQHARHRSVACAACHAREDRHRSSKSWSARDCAACHHADVAVAGCRACHATDALAAPRSASVAMALSVWSGARVRELAFDHDRHGEVGCASCHQGGVDLPPQSCTSCHESHHQATAGCSQCHEAPGPAVHDVAVHGSCAGAGCHSVEGAARPMLSRSSCELCHEAQREHRPGRSCARCHIMPRTGARE